MRYLLPAVIAAAAITYVFGSGFLTSAGLFIAVLFPLVILHELGHFTVAKLCGIEVLEFGVGMPPKLVSVRRGETEYSLNLLPIGGFVRMLGEEDPSAPRSFASQAAWKRLLVLAAGPGMNAIIPVVLLFIALVVPRTVTVTDVAIVGVVPGGPADRAGIEVGDILREVQGNDVINSSSVQAAIQTRLGADMNVVVERQGQRIGITIPEVRVNPPEGEGATGIQLSNGLVSVTSVTPGSVADQVGLRPGDEFLRVAGLMVLSDDAASTIIDAQLAEDPTSAVPVEVLRQGKIVDLSYDPAMGAFAGLAVHARPDEQRSMGFLEAAPAAFKQLWEILVTFRNEIGRIFTGSSTFEFSGPVGIAQITRQVADAGLASLVMWTALLSINLAIINILPLPALDGGRIGFVLVELARGGRRIAPAKEQLVHLVGFAVLMALILLVSFNDIRRILSGTSFLT